jgi:hypothetical protein
MKFRNCLLKYVLIKIIKLNISNLDCAILFERENERIYSITDLKIFFLLIVSLRRNTIKYKIKS